MKYIVPFTTIFLLLGSIIYISQSVEASEGLPGSAKFGYGARIEINGAYLNNSVSTAESIGLDWIAVEFDWENMWPDPNSPPNISQLTEVINDAYQNGLSVLLTISNPASWAVTKSGPDPQTTANLVLSLVDFYTDKVTAVELFPGVNTIEGWKSKPDPISYLQALKRVHQTLNTAGKNIAVVTTLIPAPINPSPHDVNDIEFLDQLYKAGGKSDLTIIGVKLNTIKGDPYSNPEALTLRHYEEIRTVMLNNEHDFGLIWITGFRLPNEEINKVGSSNSVSITFNLQEQSDWLEEAYILMKAQLYIGAAFFDQINPRLDERRDNSKITLISQGPNLHPAVERLRLLIRQHISNSQQGNTGVPDPSSSSESIDTYNTYLTILLKKYIKQSDFKHP